MSEQTTNPCVIEGGHSHCSTCSQVLCIRKQVINLALGFIDRMFCLECIGKDTVRKPEEVLETVKSYILTRPCFKKQWARYPDSSHCPAPESCFPRVCFEADDDEE